MLVCESNRADKPNFLLYIKMNRMMFHLLAEKKCNFIVMV